MNNTVKNETIHDVINRAIWAVVSNQYKKDCKEEHETVTSYGFEIFKWEGCYYVKNPKTEKTIHAKFVTYWRGLEYKISGNWLQNEVAVSDAHPLKFDFVGYLNKPVNPIRKENMVWKKSESDALNKYEALRNAKWYIQYHKEEIEKTKKKIENLYKDISSLQNDLIYHAKHQIESEQNVKDLRREYGLKEV